MNFLYPNIAGRQLPAMLLYALSGFVLAGIYGAAHDQITYSISPEYFTRLKFMQFHYLDFKMPTRILVAEIGFVASAWVGFVFAWFLARVAVPAFLAQIARRYMLHGFGIIWLFTIGGAVVGFLWGVVRTRSDLLVWANFCAKLGITDVPHFVQVAFIHNGSYAGALVGFVVALVYIMRRRTLALQSQTSVAPLTLSLSPKQPKRLTWGRGEDYLPAL